MTAEDPLRRDRDRRRELMLICVFCAALLVALGAFALAKRGTFQSTPLVEHAEADRLITPVDINVAAWPEFATLPGIGEKRAKAIVALRERKKGFKSVEELTEVAGINGNTMRSIRPLVTVGPPPTSPEPSGD